MHQKETYEITITQKLEQVSIPDLSEMIWARIESELDADPGDGMDNSQDPSPSSPAGGIIVGSLGLVVLIAFLINFFNTKKQDPIAPEENSRTETPTIRDANAPADKIVSPSVRPQQNPAGKTNDLVRLPDTGAFIPLAIDSSNVKWDTSTAINIPGPGPTVKDSVPSKKIRGVRDISSDEYKIVPKKDSL